jgi:hypothetical protein
MAKEPERWKLKIQIRIRKLFVQIDEDDGKTEQETQAVAKTRYATKFVGNSSNRWRKAVDRRTDSRVVFRAQLSWAAVG